MSKDTAVALPTITVPPEKLISVSNARFGLKKFKIEALAESILNMGGIHTPLEVYPGEQDGTYVIGDGHYRQAAAALLNKRDNAGITCPCIVKEAPEGELALIKTQLSHNQDRENLSPMDIGAVCKRLLDLGMPRADIRAMFPRQGGKKGTEMTPMSNALMNMYISFLDLPKKVQTGIHEGTFGVKAAYTLTTKPKEQWDAIVAEEEAERLKSYEADEKMEEKFLAGERKSAEQEERAKKDSEALTNAAKVLEEAKAAAKAKLDAAAEAYKLMQGVPAKEKEAKAKAAEHHKACEADVKAAQKAEAEAEAAVKKAQDKVAKAEQAAEERRKKLEEARKNAPGPTQSSVNAAAQRVSGGTGAVAPSAGDVRKALAEAIRTGAAFPKATAIYRAFYRMATGVTTPNLLYKEVTWLVGENKTKPAHVAQLEKAQAKAPAMS